MLLKAGAVMFGAGEAFEALTREYDGNFHEMLDQMTRILRFVSCTLRATLASDICTRNCRLQVRSKWTGGESSAMPTDKSEDAVAYTRRDWSPGTQENNCDGYWRVIKECLREDLGESGEWAAYGNS